MTETISEASERASSWHISLIPPSLSLLCRLKKSEALVIPLFEKQMWNNTFVIIMKRVFPLGLFPFKEQFNTSFQKDVETL